MAEGASLPLLVWLSPAFPVGSFAFSSGLEWAVAVGDIADADDLARWLDDLREHGALRADMLLLAAAWRAPRRADEINELALALTSSAERHLETSAQGTAFLKAVEAAWPAAELTRLRRGLDGEDIAYPVVVGVAAAAHEIPLRATLEAFGIAAIGNLVSAVLRLGPIGQSEAQTIIAASAPAVIELTAWAESAPIEEIGTAAFRADIAAMRHETQYSRLFRS